MNVLLVGAELEENLALRYLAAVLEPRGHRVRFARFDGEADTDAVLEQLGREPFDLVGMSMTFQFRAREFGALAAAMRARGYRGHVTVGGHFPTFAYAEVLAAFPEIDTVVRHEGEETIVELCDALARRGGPDSFAVIRGLAYRGAHGRVVCNAPRPLLADLDALPFPKRTGPVPMHLGIPAAFLVGSRGCYGHCTFCCIHAYVKDAGGPKYRARSPASVAAEMAELSKTRGARMFVFHDDDFFTRDHERDLVRVTALRDELVRRGVRDIAIVVKARPDDVDARVFDVLEEIGLLRVYLGIESGSTEGLRTLGRGVAIGQNRRALEFLRAREVYTCFNMLVFDPESRLESLRESFSFLRRYADVPMNFCRTEIYVGTPLMAKLAREGRLRGDVFGWDYEIRDPRAERAFRIFAQAFLDRNFRCDGLMNATLGLGYHLHLLRTFYPKAMRRELRELAEGVTRRVNTDCVDRMEAILDFAGSRRAEDPRALEDFAARATEEVTRANAILEEAVHEATRAIFHAVEAPRAFKPARTIPKWQALSAAAVALAPLACERTAQPPPPDPLPQPTYVQPPPPDPLPPPTYVAPTPSAATDAGASDAEPPKPPLPPPPDPLPPPRIQKK